MIKGSKKKNGKEVRYTIRFSKEESDILQKKAKLQNMSVSEYIRYLVKKEK